MFQNFEPLEREKKATRQGLEPWPLSGKDFESFALTTPPSRPRMRVSTRLWVEGGEMNVRFICENTWISIRFSCIHRFS